jgi:hypothetical protein
MVTTDSFFFEFNFWSVLLFCWVLDDV